MAAINSEIQFGLVHGSWHGAWCWELLQAELDNLGYRSIAMDLPIADKSADFDDYAATVAKALAGVEELVLVGHSRSANVIPRAAGQLAVRKLIYLCGGFESLTIGRPTEQEAETMPPRNSDEFFKGIIYDEDGATTFDPDMAKELFYGDCSADLQDWAASQMKPQHRFNGPEFNNWPEIEQDYILCSEDRVINPDWSRYIANNWLGIEPIEMGGLYRERAVLTSYFCVFLIFYSSIKANLRTKLPQVLPLPYRVQSQVY